MGDCMADKTTCSDCGYELIELTCICPKCGSNKKTFHVSIVEKVTARDGLKAKRPGKKRPYFESLNIPSLSVRLKKIVNLIRIIDRDKNHYHEKVSDYDSGEIIHECKESLTDHVGHGTEKINKLKKNEK